MNRSAIKGINVLQFTVLSYTTRVMLICVKKDIVKEPGRLKCAVQHLRLIVHVNLCFGSIAMFFNFQKFEGAQAPPAPPPATGLCIPGA